MYQNTVHSPHAPNKEKSTKGFGWGSSVVRPEHHEETVLRVVRWYGLIHVSSVRYGDDHRVSCPIEVENVHECLCYRPLRGVGRRVGLSAEAHGSSILHPTMCSSDDLLEGKPRLHVLS